MNSINRSIIIGISLVSLSLVSYTAQILIFKRPEETFFYMLQDIAFIPIQVLIVTLIINELLARSERRSMMKKMNMVIGAFFSEMGLELLKWFSAFDVNNAEMKQALVLNSEWDDRKFNSAAKFVKAHNYVIDCRVCNLGYLKSFLSEKRYFLLTLLENPNLLEHLSFTDLLWAVSHLSQELELRKDVSDLSEVDMKHVSDDIKRAYSLLTVEWLSYVKHLKEDYPFSFSLAIRTNPFDDSASIEVK